jgi:hypothetical protein
MNDSAKKKIKEINEMVAAVEARDGYVTTENLLEYSKDESGPTYGKAWSEYMAASVAHDWQKRQKEKEKRVSVEVRVVSGERGETQ